MLLPHRIQNRTLRGIGEIRPSEMCRTTRASALGYARPPLRGYQDSRLTGFEPPDGGVRT